MKVTDLPEHDWNQNNTRWMLTRAVCGVGSDVRFPPAMALYHYAHQKKCLELEVENFAHQFEKDQREKS